MGLLGDLPSNLSDLQNKLANPFDTKVEPKFRDQDFPEGFLIEELDGPKVKVRLVGNMMPKIPFTYGGEQRMKKEFYAGHSEPVHHILGPQESDTVLNGRLYDKRYQASNLYGVSTEIAQQIDAIRIRGNLCRFVLGEWERYGFIKQTNFDMKKLSDLDYSITIDISGFNAPRNAKFLQKRKIVPFAINQELIAEAEAWAKNYSAIPETVPQSLADKINSLFSEVASAIKVFTDFMDTIINSVQDVQKAIQRGLGLIKHVQNKIRNYKNFVGSINPFGSGFNPLGISGSAAITGRYNQASFFAGAIAGASFLQAILNRYRAQFKSISDSTPLGRHIVKAGDNLQKIANKFYGDSENWKKIYDYNSLSSTELEIGKILEIPRL
jgi:hypothetical protein